MEDIGKLGNAGAVAIAVNNLGEVIGISEDINGRTRSFIWSRDEGMRALTLPAGSVVRLARLTTRATLLTTARRPSG